MDYTCIFKTSSGTLLITNGICGTIIKASLYNDIPEKYQHFKKDDTATQKVSADCDSETIDGGRGSGASPWNINILYYSVYYTPRNELRRV